jgi:hypothetical protein
MTIADVAAALTGEGVFGKHTGGDPLPSREEIARLAYQFYEARGRQDKQDLDDWLSAEQELSRQCQEPRRKRSRAPRSPGQTVTEVAR